MENFVVSHINIEALQHNFNRVRELSPHSKIVAMVKSNAYGHGLARVVQALKETDAFGVTTLQEAGIIRKLGLQQPIVIVHGFSSLEELQVVAECRCEPVIYQNYQIDILVNSKVKNKINIWLKINSGMNRLGFFPEEIPSIVRRLRHCARVNDIIFMTHFSDADQPSNPKTLAQIETFKQATKGLEGEHSLANSAGILYFPESHREFVRPGIMLYGVSPSSNKTGACHGLQPVMTLTSTLISIRQQKKADAIGYGSTCQCQEDALLGIAPIGYADGYSWHIPSNTPVLIRDKQCRTVGRVSMNLLAINLNNCPQAKIGDTVVLWGERLPVEKIAEHAGTIPYELLCGVRGLRIDA